VLLRLEATPGELVEKSEKLVRKLRDLFWATSPELAESLEKALPRKEQDLKYPVLRELKKQTAEIYDQHMQAMLKEIGKVLDRSVEKSLGYDHTGPIAEKDDVAYKRVKQVLINMGWEASDFEQGGPLYGYSVNQLIDLARGKQKNE